jgi:FixJ family two-component response regulator
VNRAIDPAGPGKTARFVGRFAPGAQIVFLQDAASVDDAVEEMRMGAIDVLVKPIDPERLLRTLRDGFKRDAHLGGVRGGGIRHLHVTGFPTLTNREREVLELIMNGKSNNEAAVDLGISPRTVEVHRARVMKKLGATNSVSLANIFLQATRGY